MTEIGVWAIVILLAVIAYIVGRRDWAHERQISAVLTSLSDTYRTGFDDVGLDDEPRTYLRGRSTTGRGARELRRQLQAALDARVVKTQAGDCLTGAQHILDFRA